MTKKFDLAGIGNACMDIVAGVDDGLLPRFGLTKGICTGIDLQTAGKIYAALENPAYVPGGCAANTAACMASLGNTVALLGRAANDPLGDQIVAGMEKAEIYFSRDNDIPADPGSTRVFCLTTPDGQRTFASYYGTGENLNEKDMHVDVLANCKILYLDGFTFASRQAQTVFPQAAETARRNGARISFTPSDLTVIEKNPALVSLFVDSCDIFLCNDGEAKAIAGTEDITVMLRFFQKKGITGAITGGEKGAWVFDARKFHHIPALPAAGVIDTNGAGDHFAAGFMHGLLEDWPLEKCGQLGALCSADALTHRGARPLQSLKNLKEKL